MRLAAVSRGCCSPDKSLPGTQEFGGRCDRFAPDGGFGFGGDAGSDTPQGTDGGGWHGGCTDGVGGGGSGYVSPISLSGSFPGGADQGNGKVIVTTTTWSTG